MGIETGGEGGSVADRVESAAVGSEIGSLDGHIACRSCRKHIVVESDEESHSALGLVVRRGSTWRLRGLWCEECSPRPSDGLVVEAVLEKSVQQTPRAIQLSVVEEEL